ncbi:MAG: hypothetical protein Tsb0016_07370 [Sphingomonadales bacterium]
MSKKPPRDPLIVDEDVLRVASGGYIRLAAKLEPGFQSKRSAKEADCFWEMEAWARGVLKAAGLNTETFAAEPDGGYQPNSAERRARAVLGSCHLARKSQHDWERSMGYALRAAEAYWKGKYGLELEPAAQATIAQRAGRSAAGLGRARVLREKHATEAVNMREMFEGLLRRGKSQRNACEIIAKRQNCSVSTVMRRLGLKK